MRDDEEQEIWASMVIGVVCVLITFVLLIVGLIFGIITITRW